MYRAVALAGLRKGIDWSDKASVEGLTSHTSIQWQADRILLDGEDVSDTIRTNEVTGAVGQAADHPTVRHWLVQLQRLAGKDVSLVTEGRDQGSVVFPDAACKIFLVARPEERARRRVEDFRARGEEVELEKVLSDIVSRDRADESRPIGALVKPAGAISVDTDGLSIDEVVERLVSVVRDCEKSHCPK